MKIAALVPVKLNSRRLPNKNFLMLGNRPLAHYIFDTLLKIDSIASVYCYTSQDHMLQLLPRGIKLLPRPARLDQDSVSGNELFDYAIARLSDYNIIVLCHPTGPFISKESILKGLDSILNGGHDSALSVEKHLNYAWYKNIPLNYEPEKMCQTQDLVPLYTETSGFYAFTIESYIKNKSRIGVNPCFVEVSAREAVDIDDPSDFVYAEHFLNFSQDLNGLSFDRYFVDIVQRNSIHGKISHVSFDLDGVIVDSLNTMELSWTDVQEKFNLSIPFSDYKKHIGRPLPDILSAIGVASNQVFDIADFYVSRSLVHHGQTAVHNDILNLVNELLSDGVKVSVVTSKPRARAESIVREVFGDIDALGLVLVSPDDLPSGRGKPCPDPILLACCTLGCDPSETIYVGDMEVDKIAAKRAGVHFVHACWGYEELPALDQVWFSSPIDFSSYLREIVRSAASLPEV